MKRKIFIIIGFLILVIIIVIAAITLPKNNDKITADKSTNESDIEAERISSIAATDWVSGIENPAEAFTDDVFSSNEGGIGTDSEESINKAASTLDLEIQGMSDKERNRISDDDYDKLVLEIKRYMYINGDIGKNVTFNGTEEKDGKTIYLFTSASGVDFSVDIS